MPRTPDTTPWPDWQDFDSPTFVDNPDFANGSTKFRWRTVGYNCPICQIMSNRVYTWDYWRNTVTPGFHANCNCQLVPVKDPSTPESDKNLWGVDQVLFNINTATSQDWYDLFFKNMNLIRNNAVKYSNAFYEFGDVQQGYQSLQGILTSKWFLSFGIPDFIVQHPRINFFTLMGSVAGNMHNVAAQILKPKADLPWEDYR